MSERLYVVNGKRRRLSSQDFLALAGALECDIDEFHYKKHGLVYSISEKVDLRFAENILRKFNLIQVK